MFSPKSLHNLLHPLVSIDSVSADHAAQDRCNQACLALLANWLDDLGFDCHLQAVPHSRNKYNLIAHRPGLQSQSGGIAWLGHSDTVAADAARWQQDPWQLQQTADAFRGLGAVDMKGFFAVLIELLRQLENAQWRQQHPLTIIATADEETTMAGARALTQELIGQPALAIIGEPTAMQPVTLHKGYQAFRVTLSSRGGHSSEPRPSHNCIHAAMSITQQLQKIAKRLTELADKRFSIPQSTLNIGTLNAGDSVNRICASAELGFDVRPIAGIEFGQIEQWLQQAVSAGLKGYHVSASLTPLYQPLLGFESSIDVPMQQHLKHCCGHSHGAANYVTEAGFIEQLGVPTVVLGPGNIAQAHSVDEWIAFQQMEQALTSYRQLITQIDRFAC
ncbi:MAG: acetylornithine deacetylase [Gammaproteobacteria bacterium]|nr:acetylornithine deacetylase [Gammaproteobacteria bacterium]